MIDVRLLDQSFNPGQLAGLFSQAHPGLGGVCTFVGEVRGEGGVEALELSHYAPLTLPGMKALAQRAAVRFDLMGILIVHRTGVMLPGEPIVCVSAAASHRRAAIDATDFVMDHLKSDSWFWKREKKGAGWTWIEPRGDDYAAKERW
ncbi:molybdenum cofactor biosynthesis protein MoaE [Novosphingobium sp.]|uniref:molybdenum cofactor biosynthesis protein MoaE n=1 Tax=Novosphingobium sp. TaxID=1874826 RepID=UPI0025F6F72D|nr:molybdenum cofactor biosynthesis protein MoaE [Novosphingobium sp.]